MAGNAEHKKAIIESIRQKIALLNWVIVLVILVLLLVIVRFLSPFLDFVPIQSPITLLAISAGLVVIGLYLIRTTSSSAIRLIEEYSKKLDALLATSKQVHEIVHSDVLLENIMETSMSFTRADAVSLLLRDEEQLVMKSTKGRAVRNPTGSVYPISQGIAGWVAVNGTAARITDARADNRFHPDTDIITTGETTSVLCVPLRLSGGSIGVIELVNKTDGPFTSEDEEFISYFADQAALSIERAQSIEDERNYEIHLTNILLDALENLPEKIGHSKRVAHYTLLMARALNMTEAEKKQLYRASLLHDIGFIRIGREQIASIEDYRRHPQIGYEMLHPINFYSSIAHFVLYHHERYDGNGYPSGLKGEAIPLEARMIFVAEAFDTMLSEHSYKKFVRRRSFDDSTVLSEKFQYAVEELRNNAGTQFDPELVDLFVNNISEDSLETK